MKKTIIIFFFVILACQEEKQKSISKEKSNNFLSDSLLKTMNDLHFDELAVVWDEAIPLGNGMLGALVWEKDGNLRFSIDRADLWDLRPMKIKNREEWNYRWIIEQRKNDTFKEVIDKLDRMYDDNPAPTKIPGAAMEFNINVFGKAKNVSLSVEYAVCEVNWNNEISLTTFVHGEKDLGWFRFEGVDENFNPVIVPPGYDKGDLNKTANSLNTQDLITLGYTQGKITRTKNSQYYLQEGWGGFKYYVYVEWIYESGGLTGCWTIGTDYPIWKEQKNVEEIVKEGLDEGYKVQLDKHKQWWKSYWGKANISLPDPVIEKQWYLDMYKFGSAARSNTPPISLQAVWTADNGTIPPWKGDYHHDLNTQLSYWPAYSGNHLELEEGFINWLWDNRNTFKKFTKDFFEADGLNVPGTTSLDGAAMGGWSQYAYTPTASAWLAHHFYLHWRYSMDRDFLEQRAYPWIKDVAIFLEDIMEKGEDGKLKLPLSSSPEIFNNDARAWFYETTNYDLALIRWTFEKATEMAMELGETDDSKRWQSLLVNLPEYAVDPETGLMYAPGTPAHESHRHFSQMMAIHPLGTIDWCDGTAAQKIISNSIQNLENMGTDWWTGYSFSWMANLQARAFDGEGAAKTLRIFAENFVLPNSFHVNGEQYNRGFSKFKYRPFTLEGNFAFAAGVQEMLIQSHTGIVLIFPAIPENWKDVGFDQLRTEGAFLVSAEMESGNVNTVLIKSLKGGAIKLKNPFAKEFESSHKYKSDGDVLIFETVEGDIIALKTK